MSVVPVRIYRCGPSPAPPVIYCHQGPSARQSRHDHRQAWSSHDAPLHGSITVRMYPCGPGVSVSGPALTIGPPCCVGSRQRGETGIRHHRAVAGSTQERRSRHCSSARRQDCTARLVSGAAPPVLAMPDAVEGRVRATTQGSTTASTYVASLPGGRPVPARRCPPAVVS